jgi:hypothetical protein
VLADYGLLPRYEHLPLEESYWSLLCGLWLEQQSFIIVEHDIVPWPGAIEEIWNCPLPWCAFSYHRHVSELRRGVGDYHGFGCVKFSAELMKRLPEVWTKCERRHWSKLDTHFEHFTYVAGIRPHHHRPPVIHLPRSEPQPSFRPLKQLLQF